VVGDDDEVVDLETLSVRVQLGVRGLAALKKALKTLGGNGKLEDC
jgi:hypothetical protein